MSEFYAPVGDASARRPPRHSSRSRTTGENGPFWATFADPQAADDSAGFGASHSESGEYPEPGDYSGTGYPDGQYADGQDGQYETYDQDGGYDSGHFYADDSYSAHSGHDESTGYGTELEYEQEYADPPAGHPVSGQQFAQVYHQPYNLPHDLPHDPGDQGDPDPGAGAGPGSVAGAAGEPVEYRTEDGDRAAYRADFEHGRGRAAYQETYQQDPPQNYQGYQSYQDYPDEDEDEDFYAASPTSPYSPHSSSHYQRYSQFQPEAADPAGTAEPQAPAPQRRVREWTPPPAHRQPFSAAPSAFTGAIPVPRRAPSTPAPGGFPRPATGVPAARSTAGIRRPLEQLNPRREARRRPAAAPRSFVPSQDRIGTAREVMTYLARRPWLQLDVVDIILGTQFDRDDVAHALIVLQQSGRIRSYLRGDRVCYSYAVT